MNLSEREILLRLGHGESIADVCAAAGMPRDDFSHWWTACTRRRVSAASGTQPAAVSKAVRIHRDEWGVPHIFAENDADLFFGFGFAMAQDRLFQLDYLRRKGAGRLAEILGPDGLDWDITARTVGLPRIARDECARLPDETTALLTSFAAGINAVIDQLGDLVPIEFDLLDYRPEPWTPLDCLLIENEFRWYLTGRLPVIAIPELAKRVLGEGPLYRAFLQGEADEECILPVDTYPPRSPMRAALASEDVGQTMGMPHDGVGSNNWVVSGRLALSGKPLVASDPHIAFEAVSCWYEAHLCGGSFNTAGMAYIGMPAILVGRNERVAWAITNNICSLRDLYQERIDPAHPGCFLFNGCWEPACEIVESIAVRGAAPVKTTIRFSRNGPIIDEILPLAVRDTGPVSLKWLGAHHGGWLTALLAMDRTRDVAEFHAALRPWHVPTFCLVFADVDGGIGFKTTGRIPLRRRLERGYRNGWDPEDQWTGLIPFEEMPESLDPERGWLVTANNRIATNDFPYPLSGTWSRGHRAVRIRDMIEDRLARSADTERPFTFEDFRAMQQDALSLRAAERVPSLLAILQTSPDQRVQSAAAILRDWDLQSDATQVGPTLFNVFFTFWTQAVVKQRFDEHARMLVVQGSESLAARLLTDDPDGWFPSGVRPAEILAAFERTLTVLTDRLGPDLHEWTWGRLHCMPLKHVLSSRGELSELLDHGNVPVKGDMGTVCNTGSGPDWLATTGSGYRMILDLHEEPPGLWASDGQSQSGQPGSPHYDDQLDDWLAGEYHFLSLERNRLHTPSDRVFRLEPL
ncbi:MAG: penicillin acylase family protein [Planctomycetaceae bacterium]|nr:penicillin acylase family protein [Planctomycetaceae bacterium]